MSGRLVKLEKFEAKSLRSDIPKFNIGDTIKMKIKVQEADKIRQHPWGGLVIARRGTGVHETFTIRKNSFGEGVEKTFPLHSPVIASLRVVAKGKVRRAKLFYIRDRVGKKARVQSEPVQTDAS